jgi:2-keto-4-pentenoate hydratase/2-oxohepta-3-ene-1,7-dioic acid hydratase in catechol pathway
LYGALDNNKVICLHELAQRQGTELPESLKDFVTQGSQGIRTVEKMLEEAKKKEVDNVSSMISETTILAPIAFPPKILCLGLNYRDHAAEQNAAIPDEPIIFMKPHTTIIGPNDNIIKPSSVHQLDYEAELTIIVGKEAKRVSVSRAESYIFGYTIMNDVSARDVQFKDGQWTRGKSFDTFAPTGPWITTVNQLKDTSDLSIRTWVNSKIRQDSTTRNMVFTVHEIIHHLSQVMTLKPNDIIATGTPSGVGVASKPKPMFLQSGDIVKIEIEGIGILQNRVTEDSQRS